jgi:hypothetical protein
MVHGGGGEIQEKFWRTLQRPDVKFQIMLRAAVGKAAVSVGTDEFLAGGF